MYQGGGVRKVSRTQCVKDCGRVTRYENEKLAKVSAEIGQN